MPITEVVNLQIRTDVFNVFNYANLSPPGVLSSASEKGAIGSTVGVTLGNHGIGLGR